MRTFKYKLQNHKRNKHLHRDLEIIAHVHNHFVALCRHYRIYGQWATSGHSVECPSTSPKRLGYAHWRIPFSWAVQNALKRMGYINFFEGRSFVTSVYDFRREQVGFRCIRINTRWYRFWYSRPIEGNIKQVTVKRDTLGDFYITITTDNGLNPGTPDW